MNKIISLMLVGYEMVVHVRMTKLPSQIHNAFVKYHYLLNIQSDKKITKSGANPAYPATTFTCVGSCFNSYSMRC